MRRSATLKRPRRTGPTIDAAQALLLRAQWRCELCGHSLEQSQRGYDYSIHHRRPRGLGGSRAVDTNAPSNLLVLCGHALSGCHGFVERERATAMQQGWLVSQYSVPANTAVLIRRERWCYLDDSYGYADHPPERL